MCITCLEQYFGNGTRNGQRACPTCRKTFSLKDAHQVFLNIIWDPTASQKRDDLNGADDDGESIIKSVSEVAARISRKEASHGEQSLKEVKSDIEGLMTAQRDEIGFKVLAHFSTGSMTNT